MDDRLEVVLISVGEAARWQLPKGMIDANESLETAAVREVREETGIVAELLEPLEQVEYWYFAQRRGERVRYHKFVHFYLMRYRSGDVSEHDHEVKEARWVVVEQARQMLAFASEKKALDQAWHIIQSKGYFSMADRPAGSRG